MEELFKQIRLIVQKAHITEEESRKRGERFNIFEACGVNHYENTHSAIIAELLNPHGSHGQADSFLTSFLCSYKSDICFSLENGAPVATEVVTEEGRIDILITNPEGQAIIIENKIYAHDQWEQLKRYDKYAEDKFGKGNYEILYLTLFGDKASEQSAEGVKYIPISYANNIVEWLEECINYSARIPLIRETLIQYQNHIKQLTNQDMEKNDKEKLLAMMAENAEQVKAIYSVTWFEYLGYVFYKYVRPKLKVLEGLMYEETNLFGGRGERGFYFRRKEWNRSAIWIYTSRSQLDYFMIGISNYSGGSLEVKPNKLACLKEQSDKDWPYGWESLGKYSGWYLQNDTVPDMIDDNNGNNKFVEYIKSKVREILEEIDNKNIVMI